MQGQDYIFALNFAMCYDNYINCFAMNMALHCFKKWRI